MIKVNVKRLSDTAILPTYGSKKAAGMDLYCDIKSSPSGFGENPRYPLIIQKDEQGNIGALLMRGERTMLSTGISMEIPEGYVGLVYARSGISTKNGLRPANCVGVIDSDYRGPIMVCLVNEGDRDYLIRTGDRIAQLVIAPYAQITLTEVNSLSSTDRGEGGFGSSGV